MTRPSSFVTNILGATFCATFASVAIFAAAQAALAAPKKTLEKLPVNSSDSLKNDGHKLANLNGLEGLDDIVLKIMKDNGITAGQVAVGKNGQVVYSKAFGFADKEHKVETKCNSLFRIASSSKPITAVAIMTLVQQGKLSVNDKVVDILKDYRPPAGEAFDPKLETVTVRHLLEHTSGFSNENGDPQFEYLRLAAQKYSLPQPASPQAIVRYRLTKPLDRDPGLKYEYSNFGYNMLGRIIEKVSGVDYETYVKNNVLVPAGATSMSLGHTRQIEMSPLEVFYDDQGLGSRAWSVYAAEPEQVASSYGASYSQEAMDAHGGWIATAEDLVKFIAASDGSNSSCHLLDPDTISLMLAPPDLATNEKDKKKTSNKKNSKYYAKGWNFDTKTGQWAHSGALTYGTASFVCHLSGGVQIAAIFNHLPENFPKFFMSMQPKIINAVEKKKSKL